MTTEQKIKECLEKAIGENELRGGSILVRKNGKDVLYVAEGYADVEKNKPVKRDSIFRMYSQTKIVTAAAVLMLEERGIIDLCRPVSDYLPGFDNQKVLTPTGLERANRNVNIYDLLSMTAGLSYPDTDAAGLYAQNLFDNNAREISHGKGMSTVEFCNEMGKLPLAFQPGSQWRYSTCADILGAVVEVASGEKFEDFLKKEIFEPLVMKDTAFFVPPEKQSRVVTPYQKVDGKMIPYKNTLHLCIMDKPDKQPAFSSGGAGLFSTLDDFAVFGDMLLNEGTYKGTRIMSRQSVWQLISNQLNDRQSKTFWERYSGNGYGYLTNVTLDKGKGAALSRHNSYGWGGWMGTLFANFPEEKMTLLFMQNVVDSQAAVTQRLVKNIILADEGNGEI